MNEGYNPPDINGYIQSLEEILNSMTSNSMREHRRIAIAKENLRNIRRQSKKLQSDYKELQERVIQLEEASSKKRK